MVTEEKANIDWANVGFGYHKTDKRYVSNYKDGKWDEGVLTEDSNIVLNESAGVLQYAQTCFEGMKAYTTVDGKVVVFRPDMNAKRMSDTAKRLEMPVFPEDRFVEAVEQVVKANLKFVPPYGTGATLYLRPFMFGSAPVMGVKPSAEYQFRIFASPVGPYFKGGAKPITLTVSDFDRAAPHGTGHVKAGLNYAMSLHAIVTAHANGYDENLYPDALTRTKVEETGGETMSEKKIMDVEDLMLDYAEMTSFDFGSLSQEEMNTLNKISNSEYSKKPYAFKYGNFKLTDFFHSLLTDENR